MKPFICNMWFSYAGRINSSGPAKDNVFFKCIYDVLLFLCCASVQVVDRSSDSDVQWHTVWDRGSVHSEIIYFAVIFLPRLLLSTFHSFAFSRLSHFNSLLSASSPRNSHMYKHHHVVTSQPRNENQPLSTSTFPGTPYGGRRESVKTKPTVIWRFCVPLGSSLQTASGSSPSAVAVVGFG